MARVARIGSTIAACFLLVAVGCASNVGHRPRQTPTISAPPGDSATRCTAASEVGLPYSFCVPDTWLVGDVVHSDGSLDIGMFDGTEYPVGFGKASSPVGPDGRQTRFVPFPETFTGPQDRRRFLLEVGFEPHAVRDLGVETLQVDGRTGSVMRLTLDTGESVYTRVIEARVPVGEGARIGFLFVWDASKADDDVVMHVISSLDIDEPRMRTLLESAEVPTESSGT